MSEKLQLTKDILNSAKGVPALFEMDSVRHNAVRNYMLTTGKLEEAAVMYYERERLLFMKAITGENAEAFGKCEKFTIYSAFIELMVSGRSLNNGEAYIIPYGTVAQFQMGWRGRLEQINEISAVEFTSEPQVVYTSELADFEYELGEKPKILKHKPSKNRVAAPAFPIDKAEAGNKIEFVYWVIKRAGQTETFLMNRKQVLDIRDQYSQPWRSYVQNGGVWANSGKQMKKPFWLTGEEDAFKKTLIKKAYKFIPKTSRMKALDAKINKNFDPEDEIDGQTHDIDYGIINDTANSDSKRIANSRADEPGAQLQNTSVGNAELSAGRGDNSGGPDPATERARSKRSHKKKEEAKPAEMKVIKEMDVTLTDGGSLVDTTTGEEVNPAAGLADLADLDSY